MKKLIILSVAVAAIITVLWFKPRVAPDKEQAGPRASPAPANTEERHAMATVLLFADPREAESSCGCAEIIQIARGAGDLPGVTMREFDTRRRDEQAERYGVRVSPTVIIAGTDGTEQARFEGESGQVITQLRAAVDALDQPSPAPEGEWTQ